MRQEVVAESSAEAIPASLIIKSGYFLVKMHYFGS